MESLINNPWIVGIVGGLISSLAVAYIAKRIEKTSERKILQQRIRIANSEIIQSTRSMVGESEFPPVEIIESIVNSAANRHNLKKEALYSVRSLTDDIISEIMSNSFLNPSHKIKYCHNILEIRKQGLSTGKTGSRVLDHDGAVVGNVKGSRDISLVFGVAAFFSVLLSIVSSSFGTSSLTVNARSITRILAVIGGAIIVPTIILFLVELYRGVQDWKGSLLEGREEEGTSDAKAPTGKNGEN